MRQHTISQNTQFSGPSTACNVNFFAPISPCSINELSVPVSSKVVVLLESI